MQSIEGLAKLAFHLRNPIGFFESPLQIENGRTSRSKTSSLELGWQKTGLPILRPIDGEAAGVIQNNVSGEILIL